MWYIAKWWNNEAETKGNWYVNKDYGGIFQVWNVFALLRSLSINSNTIFLPIYIKIELKWC